MGIFYGREEEIGELIKRFELAKIGKPQLIILEGDSGLGKTRIVQEFYEYLSKEYNKSGYWPRTIGEKDYSMAIVPELNNIKANDFDGIEWMWFAMRCDSNQIRNSVQAQSIALDGLRVQIGMHLYSIMKEKEKRSRDRKTLRAALGIIATFGFPGIGGVIVESIDKIISTTDSALGTTDNIKEIYSNLIQKKENRETKLIIGKQYDDIYKQASDALSTILCSNGSQGIPCVLVVDDCQWLDENTVRFIEELYKKSIKEQWPLYIVCTVWESFVKEKSISNDYSFIKMINDIKTEFDFMNEDDEIIKVINLKALDEEKTLQLVSENMPGFSEKTKKYLINKCDGDLEMLWECIRQSGISEGVVDESKEKYFLEWFKSNNGKKSTIKRRMDELDISYKNMLMCASVEGIVFSEEFLIKCSEIVHCDGDKIFDELDNVYNITSIINAEKNFDKKAEFKRQIYYEIAHEMFELAPFSKGVWSIVYDYYRDIINNDELHLYDRSIQKNICYSVIQLDEQYMNEDIIIIKARKNLARLYFFDGEFELCIDLIKQIVQEQMELNDVIEDVFVGIEASFSAGKIEDEKFFIEILLDAGFDEEKNDIELYAHFMYYYVNYLSRVNVSELRENLNEYKSIIYKINGDKFEHYLACARAFFYIGECARALDLICQCENDYSDYIKNNSKLAAEFYHTAGLIYHDIDLNKKIVEHADEVIRGYENVGDIYNSLLHRVNYADALMAIGKLSEAEPKMESVYYKSKDSGYRHAYNIASICYANVLSCLGKTSIALKYYEEGIKLSKEINHDWDYLYGRIWRSLSLSDFYDKKSIEISKQCEKESLDKGYDYLVSLARTFNCICRYNLGEVVELADVDFINIESAPGHKLMVLCLFLLTNENYIEDTKKYVDTIYELVDCCQGMKGRPEVLNTLFLQKGDLFYDTEKNKKIKNWISEYIVPYINAYEKVEREILSKMPDEPNLRYCDMNKCPGFCCYDGAYLVEGEEHKIKKFIKENKQLFSHKIQEYFMDGEWEGEKGRKTSIRYFQYDDRFPEHFEKTRCIFGDDNGICELQKNATLLDMHPWAYKPKACWLFPMDISNGQIVPPPLNKEDDPNNLGEDYPGYVSCLRCGIPSDEGMCWKKVYKQEILYYQHLNMLEELGTGDKQ